MRFKSPALSILVCLIVVLKPQGAGAQEELRGLKSRLGEATSDTARARLIYVVGLQNSIIRPGYWDSLIKFAHKKNIPVTEAKALRTMCSILEQTAYKTLASNYIERSVRILERNGDKHELLLSLEKASRHFIWINRDMKKALEYCFRGLSIAEEIKDKKSIILFNAITAQCYFSTRDMKKSLQMQYKCLEDYRKIGYNPGIVEAQMDIGMCYCGLGDSKNMIRYYLESKDHLEKYHEEFKNTFLETQVYHSTGAAYSLTKEYDSAFKYTYMAYLSYEQQEKKRGMASVMATLARISYEKGSNQAALEMALKTYQIVKEIDFYAQMPDLMLLLKSIYLKDKNYKAALNAYQLYVEAKDSLSSENTRELILDKEFKYDLDKKENENKLLAQQNQIQALELRQNKYFLIGVVFFVMLLGAFAFLYFRQSRLKNEQKSSILEQKLLRSQLNPHFIFNALNSIQQFIVKQQNEKAERYLAKFSKMIRKLLESSVNENTSLQEEIEMLHSYIEIESMRFSNSFTYAIELGERVKPSSKIPHMMVQPFVENAIWHGLLAKKGERHLTIKFSFEGERAIRCVVKDNGIGLRAGRENKEEGEKRSLALQLIKQRLELMSKTTGVSCYAEVNDKTLTGEDGTEAIIIIPILEK